MSNYLYRLSRFAFRRRRLVLAAWLVAAIAAIAIATLSGGGQLAVPERERVQPGLQPAEPD